MSEKTVNEILTSLKENPPVHQHNLQAYFGTVKGMSPSYKHSIDNFLIGWLLGSVESREFDRALEYAVKATADSVTMRRSPTQERTDSIGQ